MWWLALGTTKEGSLTGHHCPFTAVWKSCVCPFNRAPHHVEVLFYPWVTWWFIFPESRMALMTRLEGLWGFILHLYILNAEARGDSTSCSVFERKGNKVLEPLSEWPCTSARGRQSLLLVLWNTSLGAEALLALYKAGSWLWKLQRSQEQLGQRRQNLCFLEALGTVFYPGHVK